MAHHIPVREECDAYKTLPFLEFCSIPKERFELAPHHRCNSSPCKVVYVRSVHMHRT